MNGVNEPWLCSVFGHSMVSVPLYRINHSRWMQPAAIPTRTRCRRCFAEDAA